MTVYANQLMRITVPIEAETLNDAEQVARALTLDEIGMASDCEDASDGNFYDHILGSVYVDDLTGAEIEIDRPIITPGTPNYHALVSAARQACADPRCSPDIRAD